MFIFPSLPVLPAPRVNQSRYSAATFHLGRIIFRPRLVPLLMISILLLAQTAQAGDTKIFTFTNRTGQKATDLHVTFRGTGGNVTVNPITIVSPPNCTQVVPSSSGNAIEMVWQPQGCVENNSTVSFTVSTNAPGPLEFGEGYWTGPGGVSIGEIHPGDIEIASTPGYRLAVPDLAEEGEHFTGMVVEETPKGDVPATPSDQVVFNGQVIPQEPGGKYAFPPFEYKRGNYFIGVYVIPHTVTLEKSHPISLPAPTQHIEILPPSSSDQPAKPQISHASDVVAPGTLVRVEGQNLERLQKAALVDEHANQIPLGDSAGSSLQRIYLPPADKTIPPGAYHYVAWDGAGNRYDSPNVTQRPRLQLTGPEIKKRGQQGEFTITSDTTAVIELSGGEPVISLQEHSISVRANEPRKVKFTAQQVGKYTLDARLYNPEDLPPSAKAPKVDSKPGPVTAQYDPKMNKTNVNAPVTVTDAAGHPASNVQMDVALARPGGVEYARVTTDNQGRVTLTRTLDGNVPARAISTHVYRVLEHNWKEPERGFGGHPTTIAGLSSFFSCPQDCIAGQKTACSLADLKITSSIANDFDLAKTLGEFDHLSILDALGAITETMQGSPTALLGGVAIEQAKDLAEKIKERNEKWSQGSATVTIVLEYRECFKKFCIFDLMEGEQVWGKKTKDFNVPPAFHGAGSATGPADTWVGGTFNLNSADVRQAVKDTYDKAMQNCP